MQSEEESGNTPESLEDALAKNYAALSAGEDTSTPADSGDVAADETQVEQVAEQEQESPEGDALEPLEKWSDQQKEIFAGLPVEVQQAWLDREKDVERYLTKETQSLSETRKRYEKLDKVLNPYEDMLSKHGIDLAPHLANAMNYYLQFQQDPQGTIRALIQQNGLSQDQLFEEETGDPDLRALRAELNQTKQALAQLQSTRSDDSAEQRIIDEFVKSVDSEGKPKYPHFEQVRGLMAPLVADGKSMEDAYSEAVWSIPEYRTAQLDKERKDALKKADEKRQKKASDAKKAAEVLPSSDVDSTTGMPKMNGNWEDALRHTLNNLGGQ